MKKYKKSKRVVTVLDDIICNKCGDSLKDINYCGLEEAVVSGNYYSKHLEDCTTYTFSLCEKCLVELFDTFSIKVEEKTYGVYTGELRE